MTDTIMMMTQYPMGNPRIKSGLNPSYDFFARARRLPSPPTW